MIFIETKLEGAFIIEPERLEDERGLFARTFCRKEFETNGLNSNLVQCSISFNKEKGTLRGMHYQIEPHQEAKLVRCTMGAMYDVIIDLRSESPTFKQWVGVELTAENRKMFYIPAGFAHGFQTMEADTEVFYQMSEFYHPECARGLRWNDPTFGIEWPYEVTVISPSDQQYPDFSEAIEEECAVGKGLHDMFKDLVIPILDNGRCVAKLRPVLASPQNIKLLTEWRNNSWESFFSWFTATNEGTRKWLEEHVIARDDRLLLMIEANGIPLGHIGLCNITMQSCEIDSMLRGRLDILPGVMTLALRIVLDWAQKVLGVSTFYLRVFADNHRAIALYQRCDFETVKMVPVQLVDEGDIKRWVEVQGSAEKTGERHIAYMRLQSGGVKL
jgi:dTDP-4-dehydrorhamnose 3,5-epimerase